MTWDNAINGLFDDLQRIVRPIDAQGNPLPMTTIDVGMNTETIAKLGLGALAVGVLISQVNRKFSKKK